MQSTHTSIWDSCLSVIQQHMSMIEYNMHFLDIKPVSFNSNILTIQVPNTHIYEMLESQYLQVIRKAIKTIIGPSGKLEYEIPVTQKKVKREQDDFNIVRPEEIKNPFVIPGIIKMPFDNDLNSNFTFDRFIEGQCNKLGRNAGIAITERPGVTAFNPLFLYGGVGLGKTHLAHAIGNQILQKYPKQQIKYISCDKFTNQVVQAIKNQNIGDFSLFYNSLDVLIIDDIQFLAHKTKTQEVFFFIFNELQQNQKQLIITSDRAPKDLGGMEDRLISRFKWGLSVELEVPDFNTRMAILESKAEAEGLHLPDNVIEFICYNIKSNIRELEGMLISLVAQSSLNNKLIDINLAKDVIQTIVNQLDKQITVEGIQTLVADHFKITPEQINGTSRKRSFVIARQLSMYLAKTYTDISLKKIGESFGGKDHSTVIYSCKVIQDMMDTDPSFKLDVNNIEKQVKMSFLG